MERHFIQTPSTFPRNAVEIFEVSHSNVLKVMKPEGMKEDPLHTSFVWRRLRSSSNNVSATCWLNRQQQSREPVLIQMDFFLYLEIRVCLLNVVYNSVEELQRTITLVFLSICEEMLHWVFDCLRESCILFVQNTVGVTWTVLLYFSVFYLWNKFSCTKNQVLWKEMVLLLLQNK